MNSTQATMRIQHALLVAGPAPTTPTPPAHLRSRHGPLRSTSLNRKADMNDVVGCDGPLA